MQLLCCVQKAVSLKLSTAPGSYNPSAHSPSKPWGKGYGIDIMFRTEPNHEEILPIIEGNHFALYQICLS